MNLRSKCAAIIVLVATAMPVGTAHVSAATITSWKTVVMDNFNTGGLPAHWRAYNGPYGSGTKSCAVPTHDTVSGGYLHLKFYYEQSATAGKCGAAWYSGGLSLNTAYSSVSQRVTVRFRVVQSGGVAAHRIIPMRWPDSGSGFGEEDYCESTTTALCYTYLHWRDYSGRDHKKFLVDLTQWHVFEVEHNGSSAHVKIDGVARYDLAGTSTSVTPTLKHVVLQQECDKYGCPATKTGAEDIQIDWIRVENPA